jgi:hypothetical protein
MSEIKTLMSEYSETTVDSDLTLRLQADDSVSNSTIFTNKISDGTAYDVTM